MGKQNLQRAALIELRDPRVRVRNANISSPTRARLGGVFWGARRLVMQFYGGLDIDRDAPAE